MFENDTTRAGMAYRRLDSVKTYDVRRGGKGRVRLRLFPCFDQGGLNVRFISADGNAVNLTLYGSWVHSRSLIVVIIPLMRDARCVMV